jgi:protease-4
MDHIYANFVGRVAQGRHLSVDRVREIAKGRVWTGADALKLGLVDKLGGLNLAVAEAKRLGGIPANEPVTLKMLPSKASPFAAVQHMFGLSASSVRTLAAASWIVSDPRAQGLLSEMARTEVQATGGGTVLASRTLN